MISRLVWRARKIYLYICFNLVIVLIALLLCDNAGSNSVRARACNIQ
jgi:hypothetical protein